MKRVTLLRLMPVFLFSFIGALRGQTEAKSEAITDLYYREDQFYLGATYNLWLDAPEGITQRNFSYGVLAGFIRDMPINGKRTISVGLGLGYSNANYYSNLRAISGPGSNTYEIPGPEFAYKRNKLVTNLVELPFELRWRNSNPTDFAFWRIYTGFKVGYNLGTRSKFVSETDRDLFKNTDVTNWRYGLTLSAGYNAFTLHLYYGLNGLFKEGILVEGEPISEFRPLRFGLIFYVL